VLFLFAHFVTTLARLLGPGGIKAVLAENLQGRLLGRFSVFTLDWRRCDGPLSPLLAIVPMQCGPVRQLSNFVLVVIPG
jgi:hypothetical protein